MMRFILSLRRGIRVTPDSFWSGGASNSIRFDSIRLSHLSHAADPNVVPATTQQKRCGENPAPQQVHRKEQTRNQK